MLRVRETHGQRRPELIKRIGRRLPTDANGRAATTVVQARGNPEGKMCLEHEALARRRVGQPASSD